ncbi:MAG: transcriptional regulator, LuxR family protein [Rhodospirillales bacterium]|nr:transcriptional regulator, LuxR family protein [Rhodospirillales bacterium]
MHQVFVQSPAQAVGASIPSHFSSAKHAPPSCLTQLIDRTELLAAINQRRRRRLLIVHAPAGYGKTTLLAQWRKFVLDTGARAAWVGLEKADRPRERFVAGIISALVHAGIDLPQQLRRDGAYDAGALLETVLSHCEQSAQETWLFFEDWHFVEDGTVAELLDVLVRRMPANWHVALSSRTRPKLNLIALRAQGQLIELGKEELRFSHAETHAFMAPASMPYADIEQLADITEGWAIALQLAGLWLVANGMLASLQSSFLGSINGMADYLAAEVFAGLSPELQQFLLESSICARFNAELADAVRERSDSASFIEALRGLHGLTMKLDDEGQWYRHHRIFAEFLDAERRNLPSERTARLHACAANWFERSGLPFEAVEHARQSGDQARTIELVENAGCVEICIRTGAPAVRSLLDSLPSDIVWQRPRLRAAQTAINLKLGSIAEAGRALAELQASLDPDSVDTALARDLLIVESLRHCFIDANPTLADLDAHRRVQEGLAGADWWLEGLMHNVQGRLEMRGGQLSEAVQSLDRADQIFDRGGSAQGRFFMTVQLAICHLFLGRLSAAGSCLEQARRVLKRQPDEAPAYAAIAHTVDALLLYERNELSAAARAAQLGLAGLELAEGCFEQYFISTYVAARIAFLTSGLDAAIRTIERGRRLARYHELTRVEGLLDCLQARLFIDAEQWDAALLLVTGSKPAAGPALDAGWLEQDFAMPVHCLLALHEGRAGDALELAQAMIERCQTASRVPAQIRANILKAFACAALGDAERARLALGDALDLATTEEIVQPFFEFDARMLRLLRDFQRSEMINLAPPQANFVSGLILRIIATGKAKDNGEQLTAREREILVHLRQGGSNKMIARSLGLTENAVKFHLKNVFRKLGVDSRTMAAAVAERMTLE